MSSSSASVLDVPVSSDRVAVGLLVHFLDAAAKRGAFALEESGKIMDAVKYLRGPVTPRPPPTPEKIAAAKVATQAATQPAAAAVVEEGNSKNVPPPTKPQLK